ncbi:MoaD/ThiS family protein [Flavobacterium sp. LS1R47]|jgi:molybdopterin synthase sulfur carrier subunit|uniref:MoaD/ThiS family protein n=1 Tax=Flavobacterium frigoritolerans TaxID=2987686 RepID=A0A9X2ZLJ4_9FLAO|nr:MULTISPECIES: MoaD/ThiS family protein [Flavobacterium]KIA98615.1 thiamine biosynthesis protein ThiS [Flavobacterium sp. KMS]MCV9933264.1 MoaD/ThiS family protein [Flavobacterium frigoritolerans]
MIEVKYFGAVAEKTNCPTEKVPLGNLSLEQLLNDLDKKYQLNTLSFSIAINQKIVPKTTVYELKSNDIIALLPPFAGG